MILFFQNSANDNDNNVDNNTNNKDRICHDTDDSESSSEYESDISDDGSNVQLQPQHRSIRVRGLVRACGGGFRRCERVANQTVRWNYIIDFENPNVDKLFHKNEGPDRLSMLAETPLDCLQLLFSDKVFK